MSRLPTGAQPVVLTRLVLRLVSSMKISLSSMLATSDWRLSTQTLRRSATSGRRISLASSVLWQRPSRCSHLPTEPRCTVTPCTTAISTAISSGVRSPLTASRSRSQLPKAVNLPSACLPCGLGNKAPLARFRMTISFTKRGDTRKCRAASRCPCPFSTKAIT